MLIERSPTPTEIHESGEQITEAQPGSLYCVSCGFAVAISPGSLPECPNCHGRRFRRGSIFDHRPAVRTSSDEIGERTPEWLEEARAELDRAGSYLAFDEGDGEYAVDPTRARLDSNRPLGRRGRAARRRDGLAPARARRAH